MHLCLLPPTDSNNTFAIVHENPSAELEKVIQDGFEEASPGGYSIGPPIAFTISNDNHGSIAAIIVKAFWGALQLKSLWTQQDHRKQRLARSLIQKAEQYALAEGLAFLFVETFSFQALDVYQKMGFALEFSREGYAQGASFHYLKKSVANSKDKD